MFCTLNLLNLYLHFFNKCKSVFNNTFKLKILFTLRIHDTITHAVRKINDVTLPCEFCNSFLTDIKMFILTCKSVSHTIN